MDYVLRTNALTKSYKGFKALTNLTMNVPKGSIYGLVGKNGAGKTTLIRLICGLREPTSGDCTLYGRKNTEKDITKSRRLMGAVVETPSIYLDSGVQLTINGLEITHPFRMLVSSLFIAVTAAAGGIYAFKKKSLK